MYSQAEANHLKNSKNGAIQATKKVYIRKEH